MQSVEAAQAAIQAYIEPMRQRVGTERVALMDAPGRLLAEPLFADRDQPPFDNAAVDGYAVRAAETRGATLATPVSLRCLGEVAAGTVGRMTVVPGACVRVMTGAPLPVGADAMVMAEDSRTADSGEREASVFVTAEARKGDHVRRQGQDARQGAVVLREGTRLSAAEIGLLATFGVAEPVCVRLPRVAVVSTGDELVPADALPGAGQIRDSNRYTLAALVRETGAVLHSMTHLPDEEAATETAFRALSGLDGSPAADVIVTSGGVSVGDRDYVKPVLERIGRLELWRVAMKPGKPLAFGQIGQTLFFGLPGNPVSTMVTFELFVRPVLEWLGGRMDTTRPQVSVRLTHDLPHTPERREYVRAVVRLEGEKFFATPTGTQGSGRLASMLGANALLIVPEATGDRRAGETLDALLLDLPRCETEPA